MKFQLVITLIANAMLAHGHMQLTYPPPLGGANNPYRTDPADQYLQYPYGCCGRTDMSMCHGHLNLLGTPQGKAVATWAAGSNQNWNISGIGNHYGGSCQVGFSTDQGKTFKVATSYEGNCPHRKGGNDAGGQNFNFVVPADIPTGDAVFAWMWFNREQEFNMNCAVITIAGGSGSAPAAAPAVASQASPTTAQPAAAASHTGNSYDYDDGDYHCVCQKPATPPALSRFRRTAGKQVKEIEKRDTVSWNDRPSMLVADTKNGCMTPHTTAEVKYPNPGPDVVMGDGEYPLQPPTGNCG